jgi:murein DD-endopeptidase MepM/ murein hydrolase activator NlpD
MLHGKIEHTCYFTMYKQQPFYPDEEWDYYEGDYEEDSYAEEYYSEEEYYDYPLEFPAAPAYPIPDMGILIGISILLFFAFVVVKNGNYSPLQAGENPNASAAPSTTTTAFSGDASAFVAPYANYTLTQGLHGQSYGHLAIDLAAGRGTPVLSPINGVVTANSTDQYGNTTLVIENDLYRVLILHGDYTAQVGAEVRIGDQVGTESNHGYTTDMAGNRCYGREWCGNHTHLNIFDKKAGANVNPLDLIP